MSPSSKSTIEILAVGLLYFALAQVGFVFAMPAANISLVWLPSGLAMAAVVLVGYRAAGGVLLGALLANYYVLGDSTAPTPLLSALAVAMGNAGESLLAGALFSRFIGRLEQQVNIGQVLRFFCIALVSTLPAALWGTLQLTGESTAMPEILQAAMVWWAGDSLGIIVGFPVLYFLHEKYLQTSKRTVFAQQMGVLAMGVLLSMFVHLYALNLERESLQLRFRYVADVAFLSMELAFEQIFQHQSQLVVDISQQLPLSREHFQQRVQSDLSGPYRTQGLFALSWNPIVLLQDRGALEQLAQQQGYENFSILERDSRGQLQVAAERPLYVTVFHIEPMANNAGALGFDIYSDPLRRSSIDEALRLNAPVLTPPVALVQSQDANTAPGALLLWPVQEQTSAAEVKPVGFVVAVIRYDDLLAQTSIDLISDARVAMFDVTDPTNVTRVFVNDEMRGLTEPEEASLRRPFLVNKTLDVGGRQLQVFAEPSTQFLVQNQSFTPMIVLLVSLLMSVFATLVYVQRARAQMAREQMFHRTSQIINSTPDAMVAMNERGLVTEWNEAAIDLFGYSVQEVMGRSLADLIIPAQFHQAHERALHAHVPGQQSRVINHTIEVLARHANGGEFPAELAVKTVSIGGVSEHIGLIRDLRPRKLLEEKRNEAQKLEVIGQLTGGLAHDFNNLLGIVIANLDYLNKHNLPGEGASHARNALDAALRAAQVTRSLMAVARRQSLETRAEELNAHLTELLPLIATTVGKHVRLDTKLWALPLWVDMDKTGFSNAMINLLINARDAVQGRNDSCIGISTREVVLEEDEEDLVQGRYACVSVSDNGTGIPKNILRHVLEPFFTTKERGYGTGLGLPMVYGFARQSGGTVKVDSEEGKGTTVSFYLPILESHNSEKEEHTEVSSNLSTSIARRVLLVDDEEFLRRIAALMITDMGFVVIQASSGDEAKQILRNEPVDILVSDIAMPGSLDGIQLAQWVANELPQVSIVLTTGYLDDRSRQSLSPRWRVLEKPYRREDMIRVLHAI